MALLYSLHNLRRRFGERTVLDIDCLAIEERTIYGLLGANGAGKSTLMRILSFLDTPTEGSIFFRGKKVQPGQEARFRKGVVWVPQFPVMFTGTLLYNIEYPMALKEVPVSERKRRAMEILDIVGLAALAQAPAHRLSGGEAQRASIARALAAGAEVIHFDEPTANVDQRSLGDFVTLVRDLWETQKLSLLVTTHNAAMAAELCHRQIFLVDGRPVRQHVLPGGGIAWPARLTGRQGSAGVVISPDAAGQFAPDANTPGKAVLRGLAEIAAGVTLRLDLGSGQSLNALIEDSSCLELARTLTLGSVLDVLCETDDAPRAGH